MLFILSPSGIVKLTTIYSSGSLIVLNVISEYSFVSSPDMAICPCLLHVNKSKLSVNPLHNSKNVMSL